MKTLGLKACFFLFLVALFSGRTNPLAALTGAVTGTILLWPLYEKLALPSRSKPQRNSVGEEDPVRAAAE